MNLFPFHWSSRSFEPCRLWFPSVRTKVALKRKPPFSSARHRSEYHPHTNERKYHALDVTQGQQTHWKQQGPKTEPCGTPTTMTTLYHTRPFYTIPYHTIPYIIFHCTVLCSVIYVIYLSYCVALYFSLSGTFPVIDIKLDKPAEPSVPEAGCSC